MHNRRKYLQNSNLKFKMDDNDGNERNRGAEYERQKRFIKRKKRQIKLILESIKDNLTDDTLTNLEMSVLSGRIVHKHRKKLGQLQRLIASTRPPRAFTPALTLDDIGLQGSQLNKDAFDLLSGGTVRSLPNNYNGERRTRTTDDGGNYVRTGGRGTTRALGRRVPEEGEKRAYDHFLRATAEARRKHGANERILTSADTDPHDKIIIKRNGESFVSNIKDHVLYPSRNDSTKSCMYGRYKDPGGNVRCIKNPVHYKPGSNHHRDTGVGAGHDAPPEENYGAGGNFGEAAYEGPEEAAPATRAARRARKEAKQRRSSRISKLKGGYWERSSKRRELKRG